MVIVFAASIADVDLPLREGCGVDCIGRRSQGDVVDGRAGHADFFFGAFVNDID